MLKPITAIAALVAASALVLPTVSQAQALDSADEAHSAVVSYADLNLASRPGQEALKGRISEAARVVCVYEDSRQMDFAAQVKGCRNFAISSAEPAYEAAVTAAYHPSVTIGAAASLVVMGR